MQMAMGKDQDTRVLAPADPITAPEAEEPRSALDELQAKHPPAAPVARELLQGLLAMRKAESLPEVMPCHGCS